MKQSAFVRSDGKYHTDHIYFPVPSQVSILGRAELEAQNNNNLNTHMINMFPSNVAETRTSAQMEIIIP